MDARFMAIFIALICIFAANNSEGGRNLGENNPDNVLVVDENTSEQAWNYCQKELKYGTEVVQGLDSALPHSITVHNGDEFFSTLLTKGMIHKVIDDLPSKERETILHCLRERDFPMQVLEDDHCALFNRCQNLFSGWAGIPRRYLRLYSSKRRILSTGSSTEPSPVRNPRHSGLIQTSDPSDNDYYHSPSDTDYSSPSTVHHSPDTEKFSPIPSQDENNQKYLIAAVVATFFASLGLVALVILICMRTRRDKRFEPKSGLRDGKPLLNFGAASDIPAGLSEKPHVMGTPIMSPLPAAGATQFDHAHCVSSQDGFQSTVAHAETFGKTLLPLPPGRTAPPSGLTAGVVGPAVGMGEIAVGEGAATAMGPGPGLGAATAVGQGQGQGQGQGAATVLGPGVGAASVLGPGVGAASVLGPGVGAASVLGPGVGAATVLGPGVGAVSVAGAIDVAAEVGAPPAPHPGAPLAPPPGAPPPTPPKPPAPAAPPPPPRGGGRPPPPNPPMPARPSPLGPHHRHTSTGDTSECSDDSGAPKTKLKPFFWDKVLASPDQSMVWHELKAGSFQFNEEMMEALFGYAATDKKNNENRKSSASESSPQFIQIIEPKKSQNLSILLKALNVTTEEVCDALREGNELPSEFIQNLLKMAPTTDEELKLRLYSGDLSLLGPADRFLKAMVEIPYAFKRMESLLFMSTFQEELTSIKDNLATLEVACNELKNSRLFLKLLEAVLKTGNRMNNGTYRGGAQAFKLDTLLKLSDVKGTDGKTTLLHFVVHEIIRGEGVRAARKLKENGSLSSVKTEDLFDDHSHETEDYYRNLGLQVVAGLSNDLRNVKKAALIDHEILSESVSKLGHGRFKTTEFLENEMKHLEGEHEFFDTLSSFMNRCESDIKWLIEEEKRIMGMVKSTGDYFQGRSGRDEGAHLFVIVRDFLVMVDKACLDVKNSIKLPAKTAKKDVSTPSSPSPSHDSSSETPREIHQRLFPAMRQRQMDDDDDDDFSSDSES